jgi:hypothetical protein
MDARLPVRDWCALTIGIKIMKELIQYETVRVRKIQYPDDDYNAWKVNKRKPQAGDTGILIDVLKSVNLPPRYVVESSGDDGVTIFLSEFDVDEIEPIINKE